MSSDSAAILERFRRNHGKDIDLTLRAAYRDLLRRLGDPHLNLPPVVHVAGTNGKGSTCAFLRAIAESAGHKMHVYTSPHLVRFHERIRIAGELIEEAELAAILAECEHLGEPGGITYFEAATAAAFTAFARHPADLVILETGLGGRLDATNVVPKPAATVITRLSYDHRDYLGDTLAQIAGEKAGIMRQGVPCFAAAQPAAEAADALRRAATAMQAPLYMGGADWRVEIGGDGFRFTGNGKTLDLPRPALLGSHQCWNAGLAIAATSALSLLIPDAAIDAAMLSVRWPGRLQPLRHGALAHLVPPGFELWLDGGHNDSAGEVLAAQATAWHAQDGAAPRPLHLIFGMLSTKNPAEFLAPLRPHIASLQTVDILHEPLAQPATALAASVTGAGIEASAAPDISAALSRIAATNPAPARILICGSLYLAGQVLEADTP